MTCTLVVPLYRPTHGPTLSVHRAVGCCSTRSRARTGIAVPHSHPMFQRPRHPPALPPCQGLYAPRARTSTRHCTAHIARICALQRDDVAARTAPQGHRALSPRRTRSPRTGIPVPRAMYQQLPASSHRATARVAASRTNSNVMTWQRGPRRQRIAS